MNADESRMPDQANSVDLVVVSASASPARRALAREIAERLGVECAADAASDHDYRLIVDDGRVELLDRSMKPGRGVIVDFLSIDARTISRGEPIARAMGRTARTVIDATAGMGLDAYRLACLGYEVTAIERSPIVAILLEDGLRRALADERSAVAMGGRLRIVTGDAREMLPQLPRADVVYLDPMFPPKRKESALPKKPMQVLRALLGDDPDAADLFDVAMKCAAKRVVVKRPTHAPPIAPKPASSHEGKLARFDVYAKLPRRDET